ncbi:hypothetical protein CHS0354_001259 [Potamilus streckersoni]|uniref:TIR domain-containing protein n=1 Tax=Potamilus streckersoni TaxID=2493646 RepID=A0AAE0S3Y1_9BIVA|nr:hypothetical protein CHS0354_001259 [Potamilus streckersoni]
MNLSVKPNYDVFLVHSEADKETTIYIDGVLSKAGINCIASFKDNLFPPGREIFENIQHAVENSKVTLVLLTNESKSSPWVTLETILALEKSQRLKQVCIRLLLLGTEKSDEDKLRVGILESLPHLFIDVASSEWEHSLVELIRAPSAFTDILPAGNIALGLVYSLVVGYYGYVLPELKTALERSRYYVPKKTSLRFFILLPHDSRPYTTITDYEKRIKHVGKVNVTQEIHGGKPREYKVDLYSIKHDALEYYFVAEYPNVLNTMYQIQHQGIANIELGLQMARFKFALRKVLNNAVHENCHNTYNIMEYNATASVESKQLYNLVLNKIREELLDEDAEKNSSLVTIPPLTPGSTVQPSECSNVQVHDAIIIWSTEDSEDSKVAENIKSALTAHRYTFVQDVGKSYFSSLKAGRWKIFVISKEGLENNLQKFLYRAAKAESINKNRLFVIPVLRGMNIQEVPDFIKWVTYLSADEEGYVDRLIQTMKGGEMPMEAKLPAGDVATGLAWGFILNYLPIPLLGKCEDNTDLTDRIRKKLQEKALSSACIKKLYITIPKTCKTIAIETNTEKNPNSGPLIENLGRLKTVKFTSSGTVNRPYELIMYRMTTKETMLLPGSRTEICFLAEQATPSFTLFNMSTKYSNAGLSSEYLVEQARDFSELCTKYIAGHDFKNKVADIENLCRFVYFDDEKKSVQDSLLDEIKKDLSSAADLVS